MSHVEEYEYKPAGLKSTVRYALDGQQLVSGDGWQFDLSEVTDASFVNHVLRGARLIRLDIRSGETRRSLSYTGAAARWREDPDAATFLRLVGAVLQALDPATQVTLGETGRPRAVMFAIGLASALAGVGTFGAALATGVSGDRLAAAAVPTLLLTVLGALLSYNYAPWRKRPQVSPVALAGVISEILDGMEPGTHDE